MPGKKPSEAAQARRFAAILVALLAGLASLAGWRGRPATPAVWLAAAGAVGAVALLAFPLWLRLFRLWMKLAEGLSWVSTRVILALFFYLVLTPFGLVSRLAREDPLDLAWKDGKPSYWVPKEEQDPARERSERMF